MSVKKTGSPLSSGAESLDPLGGKEDVRGEKVSKNFEAALAEVAGQIENAENSGETDGATKSAFKEIAGNASLDTPEGAFAAVRESAGFLVKSRLKEDLRDTEQGQKIADDLSEYISKDPYMHRKLLMILQKLK